MDYYSQDTKRTLDDQHIHLPLARCTQGIFDRIDDDEDKRLVRFLWIPLFIVRPDLFYVFSQISSKGEPNGSRQLVKDRWDARVI